MPLDLSLLEKVRHHPSGKVTSRCPACAEAGSDRTGTHLVIFPDHRFACAAHGGDGAWFRTPPPEVLGSLLPVAKSLGMDAGLIGRPEHPCRLPGQRHSGTGKMSRVLWLDLPGGM